MREVAAIGQGTWYIDEADLGTAIAALRRGLDLGMSHVHTAELYGSGAAEERVAEALAGRRDGVFLVSKVLPQNASLAGTVAACERSLSRLKTDRLDCYLLHWRGSFPLEETIAAFERLQREGKILSWGVSNFDAPDLEAVRRIAGAGHPACNQVLYHLTRARDRAFRCPVVRRPRRRGRRIQPIRSRRRISQSARPPAGACCRRSPTRIAQPRAKSRSASSYGGRRSSPSQRHPTSGMRRRTRQREASS